MVRATCLVLCDGGDGSGGMISPISTLKERDERQRSLRTLKTSSNLRAYIVCFLQLRDFLYYFGLLVFLI